MTLWGSGGRPGPESRGGASRGVGKMVGWAPCPKASLWVGERGAPPGAAESSAQLARSAGAGAGAGGGAGARTSKDQRLPAPGSEGPGRARSRAGKMRAWPPAVSPLPAHVPRGVVSQGSLCFGGREGRTQAGQGVIVNRKGLFHRR